MTATAGLLARYEHTLPVRVSRRMIAIDGYDRSLALASQAFVALVPALLVISSGVGDSETSSAIAGGLGFSQAAASSLTGLSEQPDTTVTVIGSALLVVSVFGFVRSLQRTYAAAWGVRPRGIHGVGRGLLGALTLVVEFAVLVLLAPLIGWLLGSLVVGVVVHVATAMLLWWPIQWVLLHGRVGWRALLPGALLTGVGQALLVGVSGFWVPIAAPRAAEQLGLLGAATVLLSWLVLLGVVLVGSAVVGSELVRGSSVVDDAGRAEAGDPR